MRWRKDGEAVNILLDIILRWFIVMTVTVTGVAIHEILWTTRRTERT